MRHIETLRGNGSTVAKSGRTPVEFELRIYQHYIPVGSGSIPGMKQIDGWVRPFCGSMGEMLTLEMNDGQTAEFFFKDARGSVAVNGIKSVLLQG